jgi:NAD(P)-dependent dehydrogenase (short-subunit alcohol dehydrogenase family)
MTLTENRDVAIVTGAGRRRGIGRAIAKRLAADGLAVVVHHRGAESGLTDDERAAHWRGAESVVADIRSSGGTAAMAVGDVCERSTAEHLVEVASTLGSLAVLVNNHGTAGEANSFMAHETPESVWDDTLRVNLSSLYTLTSVVVPAMAASTAASKSIVHLSSTAGHRALARYGAYCASKAAVERLTEQQAIELARYGIRVNCVAPGMTPTDMIDATIARAAAAAGTDAASIEEATRRRIPMRRFATTDDIAAAVSFFVGSDASYVTGQILSVDGGMGLQ